jgi:hypothetical protein
MPIIMVSIRKKTLFWDVDIDQLSPERDWFFIIERILEHGDIDDFEWMRKFFSEEQINTVLRKSRNISKRTISLCKALGYVY